MSTEESTPAGSQIEARSRALPPGQHSSGRFPVVGTAWGTVIPMQSPALARYGARIGHIAARVTVTGAPVPVTVDRVT